jgi:hypothetical protein
MKGDSSQFRQDEADEAGRTLAWLTGGRIVSQAQ